MNTAPILQHRFDSLNCCVLIPSYNNGFTLRRVIEDVLKFTSNLVVVNDGSTDGTAQILKGYKQAKVVTLTKNKGKGYALKTGFKVAEKLGYEYAISMDSDGQHFPDDLEVFINALEQRSPHDPDLLVIGARKMDDPSVPDKSSVGNRFSTFWFWVETGIKLSDTQCGYRLYPLKTVNSLNLYTSKFELEIEVLVKSAWKGVEVKNLPVKVLYDPLERVTHFRPFRDVSRITLLNIGFVATSLFYILPRNILGRFRKKRPQEKLENQRLPETNLPLKEKSEF